MFFLMRTLFVEIKSLVLELILNNTVDHAVQFVLAIHFLDALILYLSRPWCRKLIAIHKLLIHYLYLTL